MSQPELVSPVSMRTDSGQPQEVLMVTIDDYNYNQGLGPAPPAAAAPSFQQHAGAQDKVTVTPPYCGFVVSLHGLSFDLGKFL